MVELGDGIEGGLLRFVILLILLTACSPTVPLRPTSVGEVGVTASIPASTNTPPPPPARALADSTPAEPPAQLGATEVAASSPTTRLAVVDQSSLVDTSRAGWWSIRTLGPIGQTFKPSFAGLDTIGLWTEDQWKAECTGSGAKLQVYLHEATIEGPLVGASSPAVVPDCFKGITYFSFPTLIALTPNKVYVIEVVVNSEDNWGVIWQQIPDAYPLGKSIVLGILGDTDLWFQEGLRDPTPLTEAYCHNTLWRYVKPADGGDFHDQSDCIQYVITH